MIKQVIKATEQNPVAQIVYTTDRPFRILQLTDMQIIDLDCTRNPTRDRQIKGAYFKEGVPDMDIRCFQYAYELAERVRPDLIVLTGDNVYGEFDDNGAMTKKLCSRMEEIGAPWAPVFGNHDNESRKGVRWQMEQFAKAPNCLFYEGNVTGHGNYAIRLRAENASADTMTLFLLDTNGCRLVGDAWAPEEGITEDNVDYDLICHEQGIYPDQIAWYQATAEHIATENGQMIPSLAFFHIPLKKYDEAFTVKYGYEFKKDFVADQDGDFGVICEHNPNKIDPDHHFYNMAKAHGTRGFFAGHEHKNDACIHYDDVVLAYGVKTGVATYYRDEAIGGTLIEITPDAQFTVTPQTCRKRLEIAMC